MINYEPQDWLIRLICRRKGSVLGRAMTLAIPSAVAAIVLSIVNENVEESSSMLGDGSLSASQLWNALTLALTMVIGFRTNKAYDRFWEGTSLLHQARGEWFDAASNLVAFTTLSRLTKPAEVMEFRQVLVRLMSLVHASALQEVTEEGETFMYETMDLGGLDQETLMYLRDSKTTFMFNRVEVIIHMMQVLVVRCAKSGVIDIPPPILSRIFQTLARGQVDVMNAKKLAATHFPFPYAQLIALMLCFLAVSTPVMMSRVLTSPIWSAVFTFLPVFSLMALNVIASQLEMPYGQDANDLPLREFQYEMNRGLLMLVHDKVDHVAGVKPNCAITMLELEPLILSLRVRDHLPKQAEHEGPYFPALEHVQRPSQEESVPEPVAPPPEKAAPPPSTSAEELKEFLEVARTLTGSIMCLDSTLQSLCRTAEELTKSASTLSAVRASSKNSNGSACNGEIATKGPSTVLKERLLTQRSHSTEQ
eukprot:TRINITY_DN22537_c0_g1_i1.p1 TRINITY_DN22537_c0_g1~~TRINITY_DN22537_c0_g1_i1.p1  ORF type:complete len:478 (+),score=77.98 TRINITY_DN22537_c0_g1_i1:62-1495(+)